MNLDKIQTSPGVSSRTPDTSTAPINSTEVTAVRFYPFNVTDRIRFSRL